MKSKRKEASPKEVRTDVVDSSDAHRSTQLRDHSQIGHSQRVETKILLKYKLLVSLFCFVIG